MINRTNFELLRAIREAGLKQRDFAKIVGQHESVISRVITGTWNLDEASKIKYAKVLRKKPDELFEEVRS